MSEHFASAKYEKETNQEIETTSTHEELTRERKEYVADKENARAECVIEDWRNRASGIKTTEEFSSAPYLMWNLFDSYRYGIQPLVDVHEDGNVTIKEGIGIEDKVESEEVGNFKISLRSKLDLREQTQKDEFSEAIKKIYANDPTMRRLSDVADLAEDALSRLQGDEIEPIYTFDPDNPADSFILKDMKDGELSHSALSLYGTTLYAQHREQDNRDEHLFLHTDTAEKLLQSMDDAGLELSEEARLEIMSERDDAYGNAYAWISREIVKMAADKGGHLVDSASIERLKQAKETLATTGDVAADAIIILLNQIITRGDDRQSDLPEPKERVSLSDGSCRLVEENYAHTSTSNLFDEIVDGTDGRAYGFLEKTLGSNTMLAAEPIKYSGVVFPKGTVWAYREEGYVPLRMTGFCFDANTAAKVFANDGWQGRNNLYTSETMEQVRSEHARIDSRLREVRNMIDGYEPLDRELL